MPKFSSQYHWQALGNLCRAKICYPILWEHFVNRTHTYHGNLAANCRAWLNQVPWANSLAASSLSAFSVDGPHNREKILVMTATSLFVGAHLLDVPSISSQQRPSLGSTLGCHTLVMKRTFGGWKGKFSSLNSISMFFPSYGVFSGPAIMIVQRNGSFSSST